MSDETPLRFVMLCDSCTPPTPVSVVPIGGPDGERTWNAAMLWCLVGLAAHKRDVHDDADA